MQELAIPFVRADYPSGCGPACLLAVFRYLGVARKSSLPSLARTLKCKAKVGTSAAALIDESRKRWAAAYYTERLTYEDLRTFLDAGAVVIPLIQTWGQPHFVVCTAAGPRTAYFMDPAVGPERSRISRGALESRWWGHDGEKHYYGGAVILPGPTPRMRRVGRTRLMLAAVPPQSSGTGSDQAA